MTKKSVDIDVEEGQLKRQVSLGSTSIFFDKVEGLRRKHSDWFRGPSARRNPDLAQMRPVTAVSEFVIDGWAPETPSISKTTKITAFGSCFAANISKWLGGRNYRVSIDDPDAQQAHVVSTGEGMVNSFVIRQQFEWAWEGLEFEEDLWRGYDKKLYGHDESIRLQTKTLFDNTDVFILTFGLSEVWYDAETENVFWRTVPKEHYDEKRHLFRVSSVEENRDNIEAIYQLIRKHRPDAKIIMTLSPVPLIATFRDNSCITSNSVSKSILRVAIDDVVRAHKDEGKLHYWPSYELVTDVFRSPFKEDRRHISGRVLDYIMTQFEHCWCFDEDGELPSLLEAWVLARVGAGFMPARVERLVRNRAADRLLAFTEKPVFQNCDGPEESKAMIEALVAEWAEQDAAAKERN